MSANTTIQTKQDFLEMLDRSIKDEDVIVWTQNISTIELKKKLNEKRVTFGFAADAFEHKDGVKDLCTKGSLLTVFYGSKELLSEGAKKLIK